MKPLFGATVPVKLIESALKDLAEHGIRLSDEKLILDAIQDVKKLLQGLGRAITDTGNERR